MSETSYAEGTVLTCTHEQCGCRILVETACHCESEATATYSCACGAPMVVVAAEMVG